VTLEQELLIRQAMPGEISSLPVSSFGGRAWLRTYDLCEGGGIIIRFYLLV